MLVHFLRNLQLITKKFMQDCVRKDRQFRFRIAFKLKNGYPDLKQLDIYIATESMLLEYKFNA